MHTTKFKRLALALLTGTAIAVVSLPASVVIGSLTPAYAQVSDEFQQALAPYGVWRQDPRWGDVWVPDQRPRGWRPYSVGHWVYTDDWGWYWISDDDEADWGWVAYHYGRWISERGSWFWVPGEDWSPAWVDWRRGDRYVGWAALPPDDVVQEYSDDPTYWTFVEPRYVTAPRVRTYFLPAPRTRDLLRTTVIVNRTFRSGGRIGVNPGISPAFIGAASRRPIQTYRVAPRVLTGTQGVNGAVAVRREDFRQRGAPRGRNPVAAVSVQRTTTVIQPATSVSPPQPLRPGEGGRLGTHPPRAAQGGVPSSPPPQQPAPSTQPSPISPPPAGAPQRQGPGTGPTPPPPAGAPVTPPPSAVAPAPAPQGAPAPRPNGAPPQARPERPIAPQTPPPPPPAQSRPSAPPPSAPPPAAQPRPASPPPPAPPVQSRPAPPPPPAVRAPAPPPPAPPPVARPAAPPPPVARPAPPPPPAARPAAPPPPVARPAPPPPPAARPAPPPPAAARPAAPPPAAKKGPPPEEKK